jgi:hypothetical protein
MLRIALSLSTRQYMHMNVTLMHDLLLQALRNLSSTHRAAPFAFQPSLSPVV